ncbi:hypothetical protein KSP40_PGU006087 [Platanthera guangdongensis]|uniref:Transposase (putative) gypsy type domain-containing protein n=1 Tax=Platanthera guangdongensis TaxID=2320717 RepID=A0ABR2MWA1_9ASPA
MPGGSEGRSNCAEAFQKHLFPSCTLSVDEFNLIKAQHVPAGFTARNPGNHDKVNSPGEGELAIPIEHFKVGFHLPLCPEMRQALRYYGVVPAQLNPNSVAILMAFICYMRSERIEFSLSIFRKLFTFRVKGGVVFFSGQLLETIGLANKHHHWGERFIYVSGDFGNVPLAPIQYEDAAYKPPSLGSRESALLEFFGTKDFDVLYLRRDVDSLSPVLPGEGRVSPLSVFYLSFPRSGLIVIIFAGEREIPLRQPFDEARAGGSQPPKDPLALAKAAAQACRKELGPPSSSGAVKRKPGAPAPQSIKRPKTTDTEKGKAVVVPHTQPLPAGRSFEEVLQTVSKIAASRGGPETPAENPQAPGAAESEGAAAGTSGQALSEEVPRGHRNFGLGMRCLDAENKPLLQWDPDANKVSISSLLPSWAERDEVTSEAFALGYCLYNRENASVYDRMSTRLLAYDSTRALMRGLELVHMCARRSIMIDRNFQDMFKARDDAVAQAASLAKELAEAQQMLSSRQAEGVSETFHNHLFSPP